jgi:hypothetical protein
MREKKVNHLNTEERREKKRKKVRGEVVRDTTLGRRVKKLYLWF